MIVGIGSGMWFEAIVRDYSGKKLYKDRANTEDHKKMNYIAKSLKDAFSIDLTPVSLKEKEEVKMPGKKRKGELFFLIKKRR